jgi:hypothetical protein
MIFNFWMICSNVSPSVTRPGTSSLVATHTRDSSSHSALMKKGFVALPDRMNLVQEFDRLIPGRGSAFLNPDGQDLNGWPRW